MNGRLDAIATPPPEDLENSDTDSNPDEELPEYYQPIGTVEDDEEEGESVPRFVEVSADGDSVSSYTLPNGYLEAERVISSVELHDSYEEEEDVGVATAAVVSDSEILRAFSEDESRRTAPLPIDQALRVMEAMRGVAFIGTAPDWADQVPEDQWIQQLRRIRESSSL